jgi:4-hydroxyphenylpyruvate dioxygenase
VYGNPTSPTGKQPNADADLAASLHELANTPDLLPKLFYIQLSDAERMDPPLSPTHPFWNAAQLPHMQWSRNARLFPCEKDMGGYLPILDMVEVLFGQVGFRGWVSMESFSRTMSDPDPSIPRTHAERGMKSWKALLKEMGEE